MELSVLLTAIEMLKNEGIEGCEMNPASMIVFLAIAETPGLSQKELSNKLSVPLTSMSRICQGLTEGKGNRPGLKLIRSEDDAHDWRIKRYQLTKKGLNLLNQLKQL